MPQTANVTTDPAVAVPGKMHGIGGTRHIVTAIASEDIPFGRVVCQDGTTGKVSLPKADADLAKALGVSVYVDTLQSTYPQGSAVYVSGSAVPVLRRGDCYIEYSGGTATYLGTLNVKDAAGTVADQGKATASATSADAIGAVTGLKAKGASVTGANSTTVVLAEVSFGG